MKQEVEGGETGRGKEMTFSLFKTAVPDLWPWV